MSISELNTNNNNSINKNALTKNNLNDLSNNTKIINQLNNESNNITKCSQFSNTNKKFDVNNFEPNSFKIQSKYGKKSQKIIDDASQLLQSIEKRNQFNSCKNQTMFDGSLPQESM